MNNNIKDVETLYDVIKHRPEHQWVKKTVDKKAPAPTALKILETTENLAAFLTDKNQKYGDSALHPMKIFSKDSAIDSIKVRIDDKLSRIVNNPKLRRDDVTDLAGYLIMLMIANDWSGYYGNETDAQ